MNTPILGDDVAIDVNRLIVSRLLVQANSGGGKSYALRRLLEQTFGLCQHIVIDPEGEFHTLRERFGYVLAGPGGEAPATVESAALLAIRLLELGTSAIVDISDLGENKPAFVARFLDALVGAPRELWHPVLVVVDEAHRFAPEKGKARKSEEREDIEDSLAAVIRLMDSGRKRPFCGVLATQRIAKLSKDAAYEANNVLIGRSLGADAKRAGEEIDLSPREAKQTLRKLQPGNFYVFGPAFSDEVRQVKVGPVATTHPEAGQASPPPTPPRAEVLKVLGKLKDLPAEAADEAHTADQLREKLRALQAELATAKQATPAPEVRVVEKRIITDAEIARLESATSRAEDVIQQAQLAIEQIAGEVVDLRAAIQLAHDLPAAPGAGDVDLERRPRSNREIAAAVFAGDGKVTKHVGKHQVRVPAASATPAPSSTAKVDQQAILDAIATLGAIGAPVTILSLAAWLGVHPKTKTLLTAIGSLRSEGLLDGLQLTGNGRAVARGQKPDAEAQRQILTRELDESQIRILDVLATFAALGRQASHAALAAWVGVHPKTKTLLEDIGKLRGRGYVDDDNYLTDIGRRASSPRFKAMESRVLLAVLDDSQRRIAEVVLKRGAVPTITDLAGELGLHPKTKTLLEGVGALRSRGLVSSGWPLMPTDVFPGEARHG